MNCNAHTINCAIQTLTAEVARVSPIEGLTLVVSVMAAFATIWIAILNLKLLRKQNALEANIRDSDLKLARMRYADVLHSGVLGILRRRPYGEEEDLEFLDEKFFELGYLTREESADKLAEYLVSWAWSTPLIFSDPRGRLTASAQVSAVLDRWTEDPDKADLKRPADWTSPLDEDLSLEDFENVSVPRVRKN